MDSRKQSNYANFGLKFCMADELIKSLQVMNNTELKFMFYALSKRGVGETSVLTTLSDLMKCLNIEHGGAQLKIYKSVINSIIRKSVIDVEMPANRLSEIPNGFNENDTLLISDALLGARLNQDNQLLIQFNPVFTPMLDELRHDFTWVYLEQMARLNGKYTPRIYHWCKMILKNQRETEFVWYLDSDSKNAPGLRQWLNLGNKYPTWYDLKKRVLMPAIDEINDADSDVNISINPLRDSRNSSIYALQVNLKKRNKKKKNDSESNSSNANEKKFDSNVESELDLDFDNLLQNVPNYEEFNTLDSPFEPFETGSIPSSQDSELSDPFWNMNTKDIF